MFNEIWLGRQGRFDGPTFGSKLINKPPPPLLLMSKLFWILFVLSTVSIIVVISGCTNNPINTNNGGIAAKCGNGVVDQGEQCDQSSCQTGQYCTSVCQCVNKPSPPSLPS
jgi:hypothetical protein